MAQTISIIIFLAVIAIIISEKIHRAAVTMAGAVLLLVMHIMDVKTAVSHIDFNTIGVLIGMMLFVGVIKCSGLFEYISIKTAKLAKGNPWRIMLSFTLVTAVLSAFLDNVTTVLLIGPMVISICKILQLNPVPFLMTQILASNIGGTATLIGDPPNIMIGSEAKLSFMDFLMNTAPAVIVIMAVYLFVIWLIYGRKMKPNEAAVMQIMLLDEKRTIIDKALMHKSVIMIISVATAFLFHSMLGLESSVIALSAAAIMLIIGKQNIDEIIAEVEWSTIIFFTGLFIIVGALKETGVIKQLADNLIAVASGEPLLMIILLLWSSALLSSFLDNIPFVATLIPLILAMQSHGVDVSELWWAISLGACLGGNGTLIGASANVVLSGISEKHGYPITFKQFLKLGMPIMIISVLISTAYLMIRIAI